MFPLVLTAHPDVDRAVVAIRFGGGAGPLTSLPAAFWGHFLSPHIVLRRFIDVHRLPLEDEWRRVDGGPRLVQARAVTSTTVSRAVSGEALRRA